MKSILVVVLAAFSGAQSFAQVALAPGTPALTTSPLLVQGSPAIAPATPNGGVVTRIGPRQVVIEEWHTDVIGVRHRNALRLELPRDERRAAQ